MGQPRFPLVIALLAAAVAGCGESVDQDRMTRPAWTRAKAVEGQMVLRDVLNGSPDLVFYDGWHGIENDPKTGGAWRWMGKRGIVRLRTKPMNQPLQDMELQIHGWVPWEHVGFRSCHMEFAVNGHVLARLEPPNHSFVQTLRVPRWLLASSEWVDLAITVANTARPPGELRDLGFSTTGFLWKPIGSNE